MEESPRLRSGGIGLKPRDRALLRAHSKDPMATQLAIASASWALDASKSGRVISAMMVAMPPL
eukprot:3479474-Heterocapsa_arctica.AAC.1